MSDPGDKNSLFIKCHCSCHLLEVQRYDYNEEDEGFYVSMWKFQTWREKLTWKERLRWCWNLITKGNLWADNIILTNEKAKEVANYINKHLVK